MTKKLHLEYDEENGCITYEYAGSIKELLTITGLVLRHQFALRLNEIEKQVYADAPRALRRQMFSVAAKNMSREIAGIVEYGQIDQKITF